MAKISAMRDRLIEGLSQVEHSRLNGDAKKRLPGNVNFCFEEMRENPLLLLDERESRLLQEVPAHQVLLTLAMYY